ncbi:MAG: sulfite exporter TauE/SafE family protein [Terriglobales bacterium]
MTGLELSVVFMLGLVSSLHCVQMCGPIVLSYSVALAPTPASATKTSPSLVLGHVAYNAGRIFTYAVLGAVAGLAGQTVGLVGRLAGVSSALAIVGGVLMLMAGLVMFGMFPAVKTAGGSFFRITAGFLRPLSSLISSPSVGRRLLLGLMMGFLPCGLIYAALLRALATGSAWWGAATMAAFGAGTAGALLAVGIFSSVLRRGFSRWGTQLAAVSVTVMGAVLIARGTMPGIFAGAHAAHACH